MDSEYERISKLYKNQRVIKKALVSKKAASSVRLNRVPLLLIKIVIDNKINWNPVIIRTISVNVFIITISSQVFLPGLPGIVG